MPQLIDTRLDAAKLTEAEFVGPSEGIGESVCETPFDLYAESEHEWRSWQTMPLLKPNPSYQLHFHPTPGERRVFLSFGSDLVGVYEGTFLSIDPTHCRKGLGAELVLAGFCQQPWKNLKRDFTVAGRAAFIAAHRLACEACA